MEDAHDGGLGSKIISEDSAMIDNEVKLELENEVGHLVSEEDGGNQTSERFYILNQESEIDIPYDMEATDHIVQENETQDDGLYIGDKIVQENSFRHR